MTLYFVRHGESTWNVEGRFQGRRDVPLSPLGMRQAEAVAAVMASTEHPRAIVSSPLQRARRTAEAIGAACGLPIDIDDRLMEISHGAWEGLLEGEVARRWPIMVEQWHTSPATVEFPDGESLLQVRTRFESFLGEAQAYASPLVVCTHDVIVRLASLWASHQPIERFFAMKTENAAITEIRWEEGVPRLARHNDAGHLGGLRSDLARQAL